MRQNRRSRSGTPFFFLGQDSHVGYDRLVNEDAAESFSTPNGELFIVADGLGGHAGGGVASRLAVSAFHEYLMQNNGDPDQLLLEAVREADLAVAEAGRSHPELEGLGASLVALLLRKSEGWFIQVGDSRLYLSTPGGLKRLTRDHAVSGRGPEGRHLSQALGGFVDLKSLRPGRHNFRADDSFLLCTAGLPALLDEVGIQSVLAGPATPQDRARALLEEALKTGGAENVTVQVVSFKPGLEEDDEDDSRPGRLGPFLLGLVCGALAMYGWLNFYGAQLFR